MDFATLVGLVSGTIVVLIAIFLGGDFGTFVNLPSILIVVGGGVAATIIRFSLNDVLSGFVTGMKIAIQQKKITPQMLIDEVEELARTAKMKGLIALDGMDIPDDFLKSRSCSALRLER